VLSVWDCGNSSFFNSLLYQLYEVLYYFEFEMVLFSYFSKLKIGVCHKFEVFFMIWNSRKLRFPRRTSGLAEGVVNSVDSEMYLLAKTFFLKIAY